VGETKGKPRRRWLRRLLVGLVVLGAALLVLPGLLADNLIRGRVEALATQALGAEVTVEALSLGWWSGIELDGMVVTEPGSSEELLRLGAVAADLGLWGLLFSDDSLRLVVDRPTLTLRALEDGSLNLQRLIETMPRGSDSADGFLSTDRAADLTVRDGRLRVGTGGVYGFSAALSCDALSRDPLRLRAELVREAGGRVVLGGSVAGWNDPAEPLSVTGSVEVAGLDLDTFAAVLEPTTGVTPGGVVDDLSLLAQPTERGVRFQLGLEAQDLSLVSRGMTSAPPLGSLVAQLQGEMQMGRIHSLGGSIRAAQGELEIDPTSWVQWGPRSVEGRVQVRAAVPDLGALQSALGGVLPASLEMADSAAVSGHVEGRWDLDPAIGWASQVGGLTGGLELDVDTVRYAGVSVSDIKARGGLLEGVLSVEQGSADVGGGSISISGSLPLADAGSESDFRWSISPQVTLERQLDGIGEVLLSTSGAGKIAMEGRRVRLQGELALPAVSVPLSSAFPVHLQDASLGFDVAVDPDTKAVSIGSFELRDPALELKVSAAELTAEGPGRTLSGVIEGAVQPSFLHRLFPDVRFTGPVRTSGSILVVLADPWTSARCKGQLTTGGVLYEGIEVEGLNVELDKQGPRVQLSRLLVRVDEGLVSGGGTFHADGPRKGDVVQLRVDDVKVNRVLPDSSWRLLGTLDGTLQVRGDAGVVSVRSGLTFNEIRLIESGRVRASVPVLSVQGQAAFHEDGAVKVSDLSARGSGVAVDVRSLAMHASDSDVETALDMEARLEASWVMALLRNSLPADLELLEEVGLQARGRFRGDDLLSSLDGVFSMRLPRARWVRREMEDGVFIVQVRDGRAEVRQGELKVGPGVVRLDGVVGLSPQARAPQDELALRFDSVPFTSDSELEPLAGNPRRISTTGTLSGVASAAFRSGGGLQLQVDLNAVSMARHLVVGGAPPRSVAIPDLELEARGSYRDEGSASVHVQRATLRGEGVSCGLTGLAVTPRELRLQRAQVFAEGAVLDSLNLGRDAEAPFVMSGRVAGFVADLVGRFDAGGALIPLSLAGAGHGAVGRFRLWDLEGRTAGCHYRLQDGALALHGGQCDLAGGSVVISKGTRVELVGEDHPFAIKASARGVNLKHELRSPLAVVAPVLLGKPGSGTTGASGTVSLEVDCAGTWSREAGWSKSVNGAGRMALSEVAVRDSSVLAVLDSDSGAVLARSPARAIMDVLGGERALKKELAVLAGDGVSVEGFDRPFQISEGRVTIEEGMKVSAGGMSLSVDGWGSLEGDVDYRVETNLVARLREKALARLSKGNKNLGRILGAFNPLIGVVNIELGVNVRGNVLNNELITSVGVSR